MRRRWGSSAFRGGYVYGGSFGDGPDSGRVERIDTASAYDAVKAIYIEDAYRSLWSFLAHHDLVGRVRWNDAPADDPAWDAAVGRAAGTGSHAAGLGVDAATESELGVSCQRL